MQFATNVMKQVGIGTRVFNFIIDTIIIFFVSYLLYKWYTFYVFNYYFTPYQFYVFFYLTLFVYYLFFETIFSKTPAKWITFTKVRTPAGIKPPVYMILFRSALRLTIIDPFFIPFLNMPLHDYLSKTRVVEV